MLKQLKAIGWYEFETAAYPQQKASSEGRQTLHFHTILFMKAESRYFRKLAKTYISFILLALQNIVHSCTQTH